MGNGFGAGFAGFAAVLFQLALLAGVIFLVLRLLRRRQPAFAGAAPGAGGWPSQPPLQREPLRPAYAGGGAEGLRSAMTNSAGGLEIVIDHRDRETFERLLMEIQEALGREDYAALRERTTPEVMGYLAEDLAQYATEGRRNEISNTRLLEADVAEAWREGDRDYATAALRYEAIDVVRDRTSGQVLEGDAALPTETTELWTFLRQGAGPWKLSAIQPTSA
jgi:predicted lipid-binding transport protein (Tim44 family)